MPLSFHQVDYDINSANEIASATLQTKKVSQSVVGIGPVSCWAGVCYWHAGELKIATGFSQMKNELEGVSPYANQYVKYHGELASLAQALDNMERAGWAGGRMPITGVYIEMSPCDRCGPILDGMLPDGTDVYFSFRYDTEKADWEAAAKALCR